MSADFWASYTSGALGICIGNPLDVLKVRLQAGEHLHGVFRRGTFTGLKDDVIGAQRIPGALRGEYYIVGVKEMGGVAEGCRIRGPYSRLRSPQLSAVYDIQPHVEGSLPVH